MPEYQTTMSHLSSCSMHNAPAYEPGPCDCGALPWLPRAPVAGEPPMMAIFREAATVDDAVILRGQLPDGSMHLAIMWRGAEGSWERKQEIKNAAAGPMRDATERFPPWDQVWPGEGMTHLCVWPASSQ